MLTLTNISKTYMRATNTALNNVSLHASKGEIIGIFGPNGAGKTTLVKIISGLIIPDQGTVVIDHMPLNEDNRYQIMKKIGVVLEGARNLYWSISVLDNYYYFGAIKGKTKKEITTKIIQLGDLLNTSAWLRRPVKSLSLGEKQRVAIACALLHSPSLIVLDEPSNGLDIESRSILIKLLLLLRETLGPTIIITSHDIDFLRKTVDRFILISKGKIIKNILNEQLSTEQLEDLYLKNI